MPKIKYLNTYSCPCGCYWEDRSEGITNDCCPECSLENSPVESVDI